VNSQERLAKARLEHVARAIWFAEWEEPFPRAGTITHAMAMQMAVAATEALAQAMEPGFAQSSEEQSSRSRERSEQVCSRHLDEHNTSNSED
jgi:hypothetical protein